ncbi:MAG: gliding machinery protein P42 [Metamycoplasmataceae bacterium]
MFNKKEVKNIKKDYVANTVIIYFSDTELGEFDTIHKSIRANTKFLKIGTTEIKNTGSNIKNKYESLFLKWATKEDMNKIIPASLFFQQNMAKIKNIVQNADLAIILYKSQSSEMLSYVREFAHILHKFDVFTFHCVVENFVNENDANKLYGKLKNEVLKYRQPIIPILESTIIEAYEDANLINRKKFISRFALDLIESFVVPFVEPDLNPNHFTLIKSLFYANERNFMNKVIPTMGISDTKVDWLDLSIIQALSNPIFYGSFGASETFIVTVKAPYLTNKMLARIEYILKAVIGEKKKFIICKYVGEFDVNVYSQITILAINVDESKLIKTQKDIETHIKKILAELQKAKQLFVDDETKTIMLETPWSRIKEK